MKTTLTTLTALSLALIACGPQSTEPQLGAAQSSLTGSDTGRILAFVNDVGTSFELLDVAVGLDARAARNIVTHRAGVDGQFPTADDNLFETLVELDGVAYVGPSALLKLLDYAGTVELPEAEIVEGVEFTSGEVSAVLWGVNAATFEYLDEVVKLDARAAASLSAAAPFTTIAAMGAQSYVGPWALAQLRFWSAQWRIEQGSGVSGGGSFDGVYFDGATAAEALRIAQNASFTQLTLFGGLWTTAATNVEAGRPYADLHDVAATWGVGRETMRQLKSMALAGGWPATGCELTIQPAAVPEVDAYDAGVHAFDRREEYTHWDLTVQRVPTCISMRSSAVVEAITNSAVDAMGWNYIRTGFPQNLIVDEPTQSASAFISHLATSLDRMENFKNDRLQDGTPNAQADYDELVAEHDALRAMLTANPGTVHSFRVETDALECSEYGAVIVDTTTGLVVTLKIGPAC